MSPLFNNGSNLQNDTFWDVACNLSLEKNCMLISVISSELYEYIKYRILNSHFTGDYLVALPGEEQFMFILFCGHLEGEF